MINLLLSIVEKRWIFIIWFKYSANIMYILHVRRSISYISFSIIFFLIIMSVLRDEILIPRIKNPWRSELFSQQVTQLELELYLSSDPLFSSIIYPSISHTYGNLALVNRGQLLLMYNETIYVRVANKFSTLLVDWTRKMISGIQKLVFDSGKLPWDNIKWHHVSF